MFAYEYKMWAALSINWNWKRENCTAYDYRTWKQTQLCEIWYIALLHRITIEVFLMDTHLTTIRCHSTNTNQNFAFFRLNLHLIEFFRHFCAQCALCGYDPFACLLAIKERKKRSDQYNLMFLLHCLTKTTLFTWPAMPRWQYHIIQIS